MRVRFVGHASILVEAGGKIILTDPWTFGRVFNESWALVSAPWPVDFSTVDYIWISHEHPDHFHFPSLKKIPAADKARITVLYQRHASKRILVALQELGFSVRELPVYEWVELGPNLSVYCGSVGSKDSFLGVRDDQDTILNLNDCVLSEAQCRYIRQTIGPISLLFTQFSFANWVGNSTDESGAAERKLKSLEEQTKIFNPETTVPFASFVYFCNQENARQNAWANTPEVVEKRGLEKVRFMYPGDVWESSARKLDSEAAVRRYMDDWSKLDIKPTPPPKSKEDVVAAAQKMLDKLSARFPRLLLARVEPFSIEIHDLELVLFIDPKNNRVEVRPRGEPARFVMASQVVWYMFNFDWGGDTTIVSGMYLDREFASKGKNLFFRLQNLLATEVFSFGNLATASRTVDFFWRKRWELFFRFRAASRVHRL